MDSFLGFLKRIFFGEISISEGHPLPFTLFTLLLEFVLPIVAALVLYRLVRYLLRRIFRGLNVRESVVDKILKWYRNIFRILLAVTVFLLLANLVGAQLLEYLGIFFRFLNEPLIRSGNTEISIITLLLAVPIFFLASWIGKLSKGFINSSLLHRMGLDDAKKFTVTSITRYVTMIIVILFGLSIIGIDFSVLTVIFGVLGIGIGFGLQSVVANFFAGFVLIFSQPIKENDRIIVSGYEAVVTQIRILSTVISTMTNETIIVPNSSLINNPIYNFSYNDRRILVENRIGVSYSSDMEKVIGVLTELGSRCPYNQKKEPSVVRLTDYGDSSVNFKVFTWIDEVNDKFAAVSWVNMEIWRVFKANGIEIPFPQRDVHVKSGDLPGPG